MEIYKIEYDRKLAPVLSLSFVVSDDWKHVEKELMEKSCQLWLVKKQGFIIIRPEPKDLVIVGIVGRNMTPVVQHLQKSFRNIRCHTIKKGVIRLLGRLGFKESGYDTDGFTIMRFCNG